MFLGQPRDEEPVLGQERLAVLMVSDSPPARILDLQLFWKGLSTLAHSWSHCVGRPFVQPPPWAQQAELMSASQALYESSLEQRSGVPPAWSWRPARRDSASKHAAG
eukprot:COSAG04_NODE_120_length_24916_cov_9.576218_18_plen_107_part_00